MTRGISQSHPSSLLPRIGETWSLPDVLGEDKRWMTQALGNGNKARADTTSSLCGPSNLEARGSSPAKTFQEGKHIPLPVGKAILGSFLGDGSVDRRWQSAFPLDRRYTVLGSLDPSP